MTSITYSNQDYCAGEKDTSVYSSISSVFLGTTKHHKNCKEAKVARGHHITYGC